MITAIKFTAVCHSMLMKTEILKRMIKLLDYSKSKSLSSNKSWMSIMKRQINQQEGLFMAIIDLKTLKPLLLRDKKLRLFLKPFLYLEVKIWISLMTMSTPYKKVKTI